MNDEEIHDHKYFTPLHHEIAGQLGMKQTPNYATWDVVEETAPVQVVDRIVRFIEERDASRDQQIALVARLNTEEITLRYAIQILSDTDKEFALENLQRQLDKNIRAQEEESND